MRWIWRRWAWAVLSGVLVAATAAADNPGKSGPGPKSAPGPGVTEGPRPNDTMTLKFPGEPERKVKVIKTSRKPDGSVETEVKDVATGETLTLVDPAPGSSGPPTPPPPMPAPEKVGTKPTGFPTTKPTTKPSEFPTTKPVDKLTPPPVTTKVTPPAAAKEPPKARPRTTEPTAATATPASADEGRRGLLGGNRSSQPAMEKTADVPAAAAAKAPPPPAEKKPGLFSRIFGGKKSNPPAAANTPATSTPSASMPAPGVPSNSMPPPPIRTGQGFPPPVGGPMTGEPPRTMPPRPVRAEPVVPPAPLVPPPSSLPPNSLPPAPPVGSSPVPSIPSIPTPLPSPSIPTPLPGPGSAPPPTSVPVPSIPTPLPGPMPGTPGLPTIPTPPGGPPRVMAPADGGSIQVVLPVGYVPPHIAVQRDIQPHVAALGTSLLPTERMIAARALADGRHGSTDTVKALLYQALQTDPCPAVQACCIEQLCKLGYYKPEFLQHLRASWDAADEDVRRAARVALVKMTPRQ